MRKRYFCLLVVLCLFFALSTASAGNLEINEEELKNLPEKHQIKGVKPILQGPYQCAATCMAMVLNFWGVKISKDEIWETAKSPDGKKIYSTEVQNYFSIYDFETKLLGTSEYTELKYYLYKGYPLIAFVESRKHPGNGHFIVLTGYKEKGFKIIDPEFGYSESLTYKKFKKLHSMRVSLPGGPGPYWTLVVCPKK
jgi:ABC-type bacteriocin/lantibiotic exporter with double-glycine peptidase domain